MFRKNIQLPLTVVSIAVLFILSLLGFNSFIYHIQLALLLATLLSTNKFIQVTGTLNYLLFWIAENTDFLYINNISASLNVFTFLLFLTLSTYKDGSDSLSYLRNLQVILKVFFVPYLIYAFSYVVIWFVAILGFESLDKIMLFANGAVLLFLIGKNIKDTDVNEKAEFIWLHKFANTALSPILIFFSSIVLLESLYFLWVSSNKLSYEFQLGVFSFLIVSHLFFYPLLEKSKLSKITKGILAVIPFFLSFLILVMQRYSNSTYSEIYALFLGVTILLLVIQKISTKTTIVIATALYFLPIFGLVTNPYRLSVIEDKTVQEVIYDTEYYYNNYNYDNSNNNTLFSSELEDFITLSKDKSYKIDDFEIAIKNNQIKYTNGNESGVVEFDMYGTDFDSPTFITNDYIIRISYIEIKDGEIYEITLRTTLIE